MITKDEVTGIFCIIDDFDKNFDHELKKNLLPVTDGQESKGMESSIQRIVWKSLCGQRLHFSQIV